MPSSAPPSTVYGGVLPPPPPTPRTIYPSNLGLGYAIAIALGFLVLFSAVLLTSYICCRAYRGRSRRRDQENPGSSSADNGIILPRIIFVAEDDDGDSSGNAGVGLAQSAINSYPKFNFSKDRGGNGGSGRGNDSVCPICLCEYRDAEMLRMLPDCRHCFHLTCVDAWLKLSASCPVCRSSPLPTPMSTPLAEVVPLSQYADGRRR